MSEIKVLVVDDSTLMRKLLTDILQSDKEINVVGQATNGLEALEKIKTLNPDVVTLDIEMPVMNGLEMLEKLIPDFPIPVVMLSSLTVEGAEATLKALDLGALDFITKPKNVFKVDGEKIAADIIWKVRVASRVNRSKIKPRKKTSYTQHQNKPQLAVNKEHFQSVKYKLALIGTSTGGPSALQEVIPHLPGNFPLGIVIVQHMPVGFTKSLAQRLNNLSALHVKEAEDGEMITPGTALLAPAGKHLTIEKKADRFITVLSDTINIPTQFKPSVNGMMLSAAAKASPILGVIMTGMGNDGTKGLAAIKHGGGYNIAQDEESCVVYGMPRTAVEASVVDEIVSLSEIALAMKKICGM